MDLNQMYENIKEINLPYLLLAQQMSRADKTIRLRVGEESADLVVGLSPAQMQKMAATNMLLCSFHFDECLLLNYGDRLQQG